MFPLHMCTDTRTHMSIHIHTNTQACMHKRFKMVSVMVVKYQVPLTHTARTLPALAEGAGDGITVLIRLPS